MAQTNICIIDVDLGFDISSIISANIAELTGDSKKALEVAISNAKDVQRVKIAREEAKEAAETNLDIAMTKAYDALAAAGDDGVPTLTIMLMVGDVVANTSAFALRMRKILSDKGNEFRLDRFKRHGSPHYVFRKFNSPELIAD